MTAAGVATARIRASRAGSRRPDGGLGLAAGMPALVAALVLAVLCPPERAAAQTRGPVDHLAVDVRPWGTMVAVTVSIPAGSRHDPEERAGAAWVLGHAVADRLRQELDPAEATAEVSVERSRTVFSLLAVPDRWTRAYRTLTGVLFVDPLDEDDVLRARRALMEQLLFESGAPVRDFQQELHETLTSARHPWARPATGYPDQIVQIEIEDLEEYRDAHYRPHTAAISVVGPVSARRVASLIPASARTTPDEAVVQEEVWGSLPWSRGGRSRVVEEVTNTWIGVAFPAPLGSPRTSLEMLAHVVREELNPTPPDPGVYSADVGVVETPIGPVLLVMAAVFPEVAERWEREMVAAVRTLAERPADPTNFQWQRRRFRTEILLQEALPEGRGRRLADDLHRTGQLRDVTAEIWALDAESLSTLAAALGEPRIVVFGPELGEGAGR